MLRPDSRFAFRRRVCQTHRTHRTQAIIFADDSTHAVSVGSVKTLGCSSNGCCNCLSCPNIDRVLLMEPPSGVLSGWTPALAIGFVCYQRCSIG